MNLRSYAVVGAIFLGALSTAQAQETLPCAGLSATCPLQNDVIPEVNTLLASGFLDEGSSRTARRPSTIYDQLDPIRTAAEAAGCTIDSWNGGTFSRGTLDLLWDVTGANNVQTGSGAFGGSLFVGTYNDGVTTGTIGTPHSLFDRQGRVYASRGTGFVAGRYIRKKGRTGVFVTMNGSCPVGTDSAQVLNPLYQGGLTPFIAPAVSTTPCAELLAGDPQLPSGMYNVDVDGAGGLAPFDVYCDMTTQGGGWTLYAYHRDNWPTVTAVDVVAIDAVDPGVVTAERWRALRDGMSDGMMFIDEFDRVSVIAADKLRNANCRPLGVVDDLANNVGGTWESILHEEISGCGNGGRDYTSVWLAGSTYTFFGIAGASIQDESVVNFDVWPYADSFSFQVQNELYYFVK